MEWSPPKHPFTQYFPGPLLATGLVMASGIGTASLPNPLTLPRRVGFLSAAVEPKIQHSNFCPAPWWVGEAGPSLLQRVVVAGQL